MRRATKQKFKLSIIIAIIALVVFNISSKNHASATVPVKVMDVVKGTLDNIKTVENVNKILDIDDTDHGTYNKADIQSFISGQQDATNNGDLDPNNVRNVTVTQTQKLVGAADDISKILTATTQNITTRKTELNNQLTAENAKTKKDQDVIDRLTSSIADLTNVETRLNAIKTTGLQETIALDVNIVKNTAKTIDDLQSIAKEELARKEVANLTDQVQKVYDANLITNYRSYLRDEPATTSAQFIMKTFSTSTMQLPFLDPATQAKATTLVQNRATGSVQSSYANLQSPKKDFTATTFDQLNYGSWSDLINLSYPSNNLSGQIYESEIAAVQIAEDQAYQNEIQAVAPGVLPVKQPTGTTMVPNGPQDYKIVKAGSSVKADMDAATKAMFDRANNPFYAAPESATYMPGGVSSQLITNTTYTNPLNKTTDTYRTGLPPIRHDAASAGSSLGTVRWDTSFGKMVNSATGFDLCKYAIAADPTITTATCKGSLAAICPTMTKELATKIKALGFNLTSMCGMVSSIVKGFSLDDLFKSIGNLF